MSGNDWKNIIPSASGRDEVFTKSPRRDTSRQSAQLWNSSRPECHATSSDRELEWFHQVPKCPREDWRGKSCWLHPRESGPEVVQGPGGVTTSPTLLGPVLVWSHVLVWSQQNYLKLVKNLEVFWTLLGLLPPQLSPEERCTWKWMNETSSPDMVVFRNDILRLQSRFGIFILFQYWSRVRSFHFF